MKRPKPPQTPDPAATAVVALEARLRAMHKSILQAIASHSALLLSECRCECKPKTDETKQYEEVLDELK